MAPKKKKRKYSSSVAAAARDALYSSSSDSSSEEEESESDDESEQPSSSSEEDDEPIRKKKKVSASSKSNTSTKAKYSRRHLKPLFEKGDKVSSAWWKEKRSGEPQWYPGSIKSYTEEETNSPYGPTRYYDIDFDDGDELYHVEDYFVFPEVDYILQQKNDFKPNWIGVKNVRDKSVKKDKSWASVVGWYVATLGDGKESKHARLSGKYVYSFAVVLIYCAVCIANTNNEHILCTKLYTQMQWMPMTIILYKPRGRKQRNRN